MSTKLSDLLRAAGIPADDLSADPLIAGLSYDSRETGPGDLFFALDGVHSDGHRWVGQALSRGAVAVVHVRDLGAGCEGVPCLRVADARTALSALAAAFYAHPSSSLKTVGVTGTDGKSTTVSLIDQFLSGLGEKSGFLSTVAFKPGCVIEKNPYRQSTPEAPQIHELLDRMRRNGKEFAVIEATSHGLSRRTSRLADIAFDVAVITNVTHEHLEFHGTWSDYLSAKTNLFRSLDPAASAAKGCPCFGVANRDDASYDYLAAETRAPLVSYSLRDERADFFARDIVSDIRGSRFTLVRGGSSHCLHIPLPGLYNVENFLAALAAVEGLSGSALEKILPLVSGLKGVDGRMVLVEQGQPFTVIVDYAHTPNAFDRLFGLLRPLVPGRIIAVFGSAGERDAAKRPMQGRIASQYADIVILANEDPRLEDEYKILSEIAAGCSGKHEGDDLFLVPDRRLAMRTAFRLARAGDAVVLLGKGHESSIITRGGPIEWNEVEIAKSELDVSRDS